MPVIDVNGAPVHIQELNKGAGETVLLIHGMFSNLSTYYFNIAPILASTFHVVMYDMKSHGMSARANSGYDLQSMTDDLLALMNALQLKSVHLAGYSYGGLVALKMAVRFPEKIKKLAIIEAPDPSDHQTLGVIDMYSKEFLVDYINNFTDTTRVRMGKRQLEKNHRMYEYLFNETTIRDDMYNERSFFSDRSIKRVQHDTLLIYGSASNCAPSGQKLQQRINRSKLVFINGDHNVPVQEPIDTASQLKNFFESKQRPVSIKQIPGRIWQSLRLSFLPSRDISIQP